MYHIDHDPIMDALVTRISADPAILAGKPIVAGTWLSVEFLLDLLVQGWSEQDILSSHSGLGRADLVAGLGYARDAIKTERVYPNAA